MILQHRQIFGIEATLFREGPPPIYVLSDGRFAAEWGGKWIAKRTVKALEKAIGGGKASLKIMTMTPMSSYQVNGLQVTEAVEFLDKKIINKDGKKVYKGWHHWYVYNDDIARKLIDLEKRRAKAEKEFVKEYEAIIKRAIHVDSSNFKEMLNGKQEESES